MKKLETTDKNLVNVAIGCENDLWYVQTTDVFEHTSLSEGIQEGLSCKSHALAIAMIYMKKYGIELQDWNHSEDKYIKTNSEKVVNKMDKVTIEIDTVNSAFKDDSEEETEGQEIARILRLFADKIEDRYYPEMLKDMNGNKCGKVSYE